MLVTLSWCIRLLEAGLAQTGRRLPSKRRLRCVVITRTPRDPPGTQPGIRGKYRDVPG
ncbi:hypothetical protein CHLRE_09g387502v5 [Chlamydomonas reinhardtii]|uniref:Uncharacterized protein n=1 Tax=Chlamydomonas reinhardtii TaxID=3055 RepID=A0A2K3DDR1_CHLRE|nr:uncharacterized protein CHLRE_09g387502v5 [Chlamydomonas reinhardtii]PNW78671.1 hypothetical protein CHLRE_09g387502v5 [Chlamydomonas reinhardtii]